MKTLIEDDNTVRGLLFMEKFSFFPRKMTLTGFKPVLMNLDTSEESNANKELSMIVFLSYLLSRSMTISLVLLSRKLGRLPLCGGIHLETLFDTTLCGGAAVPYPDLDTL